MKKITFFLLLALMCMAGSRLSVMAQGIPEPTAQWNFNSQADLMTADIGSLEMTPAVLSQKSIRFTSVEEAGIVQAEGPTEDSKAIHVPATAALKVSRAAGSQETTTYSILMDVKMPNTDPYNGLFQTDEANANDGDLFINGHKIGVASMGGYFGNILNNKWYRIIITYSDGTVKVYVDGERLINANPDANNRHKIGAWGFYLFCDEDGEKTDTYVSRVSFWETPLTEDQVAELGMAAPPVVLPPTEIATAQDLVAFSEAVNGGKADLNAILTADIDMSGVAIEPIGSQSNLYMGTFDGQGHIISNLTIEKPGTDYVGLFGCVSGGATIKNMVLKNAKIVGNAFIGIVGGSNGGGTVKLDCLGFEGEAVGTAQNVSGIIGVNMGSSATFLISNCYVTGKVEGARESAAITGWTGGSQSSVVNCWSNAEVSGNDEGKDFYRNDATVWSNCYNQTGLQVGLLDEATLTTGEFCYILNGGSSDGAWYQTIGQDAYPVLTSSSKKVYANPSEGFRCDGQPMGETTFSNTPNSIDIPAHTYDGGICAVCGQVNAEYLTPNAGGSYELASAKDVVWFANFIASTKNGALNAILTADIQFTDEENDRMVPIGSPSTTFSGVFDGQNHKVSGFNMVAKAQNAGFFGHVQGGTVKNFSIEGDLTCFGPNNGAIAMANNATIENVHSALNILVPADKSVTHTAGVVGDAQGSTVVRYCTFSGVHTVEAGHDCFGAVVGYTNTARVEYCANYGQLLFANVGCYAGGIVAYINNSSNAGISNCLNVGEIRTIDGSEPQYGGAIIGRLRSWNESVMGPNYWLEGSAARGTGEQTSAKSQMATLDQMNSGEVAWFLNNETFINPVWYQNVGEDEYPVLDSTHGLVYGFGGEYGCVKNGDVNALRSALVSGESAYVQNLVAQKTLKEAYQEKVSAISSMNTIEEISAAYTALMEDKAVLKENADAYQAFIDKVEATKAELEAHPEIICPERDILEDYLNSSDEPSEEHPYGGAQYIIENELLGTAEIKDETARINTMLDAAISNSLQPGSDITRFVVNPDFSSDGVVDGWSGSTPSHYAHPDGECVALEARDGRLFDLHQTVTGLPNGYYIISANAVFRPGSMPDANTNYGAYIYINNNMNYVMAGSEDAIPEDAAVSKENCYLEDDATKDVLLFDDNGNEVGWAPNRATGMVYAIKGGRYADNLIVTHVTDGSVTFGILNVGTPGGNDWMGLGNFKLTFAGPDAGEDALPYIQKALQSQVARAKTVLDYMGDVGDFKLRPNFSNELRTALADAVQKAESAATVDDAYAQVTVISDLFKEIYESKRAYASLINMCEAYLTVVFDEGNGCTPEEMAQADQVFNTIVEKWTAGAYTTEEAWAQGELVDDPLYKRFYGNSPEMVDGIYQITDPDQILWFSNMVKAGYNDMNVALAADIDMTGVAERFKPIGSSEIPFTGTFDGQNHKITGFSYVGTGDYNGFFGYADGASIEDFSIDGTLTAAGTASGAIGWIYGGVVRNVHSSLVIDATQGTVHHVGGVVGSLRVGTAMDHCTFSGTLTVGESNDCFGGIAGYSHEYASIENCAHYGKLYFASAGCYAGGILGYLNNASFYGVKNCISVGDVKFTGEGAPTYGGAIVGRLRDHNANYFGVNYWLEGSAARAFGEKTMDKSKSVTAEQLASGEICFLLNAAQANGATVWFQTLGEDAYPVLDDTHKTVSRNSDGTYTNEFVDMGDGSKERPFVVKSAEDMANLINMLVSGQMNYVVMEDDIDMSGITDWKPLFDIADQSNGYPYIDFDGKNHVIRNFTSNNPDQWYNGIFGVLCGNVRNLGVENANVECQASGTGILAGYLGHSTYAKPCYVENVWVTGKLTVTNGYCGGMFGNIADESHFLNCYANVEITGSSDLTGGIIGRVRGMVDMVQCYAAGSINRGGGIIGGGFQDATPLGTYKHVVVWNNTDKNFGPARDNEDLRMIEFYDGSNFSQLQQEVVAWDPEVWYCDMAEGSYPVLKPFSTGIASVRPSLNSTIYDLQGRKLEKISQKGVYIIDGKTVLVR
ncbi:MAG: hypothetical protein K6F20_13630 [Bacteroidaceae bacterium]|nr:hypothetical protein [Bacteroidaceae bacterium]